MRAARLHAWGGSPVLEEVPEPSRKEGELLVEVQAGAVAHLDATVAGGDFHLKPELPYVGGVEGSGVVLESEDSQLPPGTQVVLRGGGLGLLRDGTWSERLSVPPKACMPLDVPLAPEVAASFFVPATTAYVALHDVGQLQPGQRVVVVGAAGAVGAMAVQQAVAAGAEVLGVVGRAESLAHVPAGAEPLLLADAAERLAADRSVDLLVDTLGGPELIARTRWVRQGGRAAVVGYTTGTSVQVDLPSWLLDDVALLPVNMIRRERRAREVCGALVQRLGEGELTLAVETFTLDEAATALDALRAGHIRGRAVVLPR